MKKIILKIGISIAVLPILFLPSFAHAIKSSATLLGEVQAATDDTVPVDLTSAIGDLINVILSVLGIAFVGIVVYAGFLYLTAGGEEKNVEKAKKLLSQAVIGIVIVLLAYSISAFVIGSLEGVTTTNTPAGVSEIVIPAGTLKLN